MGYCYCSHNVAENRRDYKRFMCFEFRRTEEGEVQKQQKPFEHRHLVRNKEPDLTVAVRTFFRLPFVQLPSSGLPS